MIFVLKSMKLKVKHSVHKLRKLFQNFLWAVWKSLPKAELYEQNPKSYAPVDGSHKQVLHLIGTTITEFLFKEFSKDLISELSKPRNVGVVDDNGNELTIVDGNGKEITYVGYISKCGNIINITDFSILPIIILPFTDIADEFERGFFKNKAYKHVKNIMNITIHGGENQNFGNNNGKNTIRKKRKPTEEPSANTVAYAQQVAALAAKEVIETNKRRRLHQRYGSNSNNLSTIY